jgi:hypothetical protein
MPSSCGQPIILSVVTMDLAPVASMNASTSSVTPASLRLSAPSANRRRRWVASASSAGTMLAVSLVALVSLGHRGRRSQRGSRGVLSWLFCAAAYVHAQSSVVVARRHPDNQIIGRAKKITWNRPSVRAGLGRAATPPHRGPPLPRTRAPRSVRKVARRQA